MAVDTSLYVLTWGWSSYHQIDLHYTLGQIIPSTKRPRMHIYIYIYIYCRNPLTAYAIFSSSLLLLSHNTHSQHSERNIGFNCYNNLMTFFDLLITRFMLKWIRLGKVDWTFRYIMTLFCRESSFSYSISNAVLRSGNVYSFVSHFREIVLLPHEHA